MFRQRSENSKGARINDAMNRGDLSEIQKLFDPHYLDQFGQTMLHLAAYRQYPEVVQFLLDSGLKVSVTDTTGNTPLHVASMQMYSANAVIVDLLVNACADKWVVNICNSSMQTPLFLAVITRYTDAVRVLLSYGADPNIADITGCYALHHSIKDKQQEITQLLLDHGADILIKENGITGWELMALSGQNGLSLPVLHEVKNHKALSEIASGAVVAPEIMGVVMSKISDIAPDHI